VRNRKVLTAKTTRWILIACGVAALLGLGCGSDNDPSAPVPSPKFTVVSIAPEDQATSISLLTQVTATFSGPVDPATITATSFQVQGVAGTAEVEGDAVTFSPRDPLTPGEGYLISISTLVADTTGLTLEEEFLSEFRVLDSQGLPMASAGRDIEVGQGKPVSLNGTGSIEPTGLGMVYQWRQIGGPDAGPLDGTAETSFTAPDTLGALLFELVVASEAGVSTPDTVSVFVCRDLDMALFVSPAGDNAGQGSRTSPFATVQHAMDFATAWSMAADIYIGEGRYDETLQLQDGMHLYGGFAKGTWVRHFDLYPSLIAGGPTAIEGLHLGRILLDGLHIQSAAADSTAMTSIGIRILDSADIILTHLMVNSGDGHVGLDQYPPPRPARAPNGSSGDFYDDVVLPQGGAGGSASGLNAGGAGAVGSLLNGFQGYAGLGDRGGAGGAGGLYKWDGLDGSGGGTGPIGDDNLLGGGGIGSFDLQGAYHPAPGYPGGPGGIGHGGGGGGSGGGGPVPDFILLPMYGAGGGGGGCGGRAGLGGLSGNGGGGSFGIVLSLVSGAVIHDCRIITGVGGEGGAGGPGGPGGLGGAGSPGGMGLGGEGWNAGSGGNGAGGGPGGSGGNGSGGGGGPSIGVIQIASFVMINGVSYQIGDGGTGGTNPSGGNGAIGESTEIKILD